MSYDDIGLIFNGLKIDLVHNGQVLNWNIKRVGNIKVNALVTRSL